ncbi:MAG: M48 family metallopeptidase [Gammaproteobacteria bacterium]|nr:M48 family metallopeptidase [Gammaproteobacteria bacterium]
MDFFGAQDTARRKTWQLAALFAAAVVCLILLTNVLIGAVYTYTARPSPTGGIDFNAALTDMPVGYWLVISLAVIAVVALASGYKYLQVRGGGRAIAESLGGRLILQSTSEYRERRLLNIVEEMAIASGTPVPPVYVIDEPSINAFAAGFSPDDAVVGVNQGTLEHLSREELQGVVAHEFSHILNGDSRLNLRLIAVLHGILFIGLVGRGVLYGFGRRGVRRSSGRGSGGAPMLALGLGFLVIGYAGTFFGNLIKAAVSRQREYLADAASVQFTRNPAGIAGALKKIGGLGAGSSMSGAAAGEASHMFFGQADRPFLNSLMATHPPLAARIQAVDPRWDGRFPAISGEAADTPADGQPGVSGFAGGGQTAAPAHHAGDRPAHNAGDSLEIHATPDHVVDAVGQLDDRGLDQAAALIGGLPAALRDAAHDPFSARALIYALVIDRQSDARQAQLDHVDAAAEQGISLELAGLLKPVETLDEQQKLTLVEMAVPALKELSEAQYQRFTSNLVTLIKADQRIDLFEWVLHRLLVKELKGHFEGRQPQSARYGSIKPIASEALELLSALARAGSGSGEAMTAAFAQGSAALEIPGELNRAEDVNFARLNRALAELRLLKPLQKPRLIKACAAVVLADGGASARQGALLQGVAAALDCPLPPSIYTAANG